MAFTVVAIFAVAGLLVFGTTTSVFAKVVYEIQSYGSSGEYVYFRKPWCMVLTMFIGMSFCLPLAYFLDWQKKKKAKSLETPLLPAETGKGGSELQKAIWVAIPAAFDLLATALMNVGLISVTASVYQMLRGAMMIFAALFAVLFLGRKLNKFHFMGIGCCLFGIAMVGASSLMTGEGSTTHSVSTTEMLVGMSLIVASQAVQAAQLTFEDFFMSDLNISPLKIVGYEGLFGSLICVIIIFPIVYFVPASYGIGLHEDVFDTLKMIKNSHALLAILLIDMVALLMLNISGMNVTGELGAVFRTVLETMRTLFVWLVDLVLFYTPLGMGMLGESWSNWSYMQAAGFVVLVAGTMVYGRGDDAEYKTMEHHGEDGHDVQVAPSALIKSTMNFMSFSGGSLAVSSGSQPLTRIISRSGRSYTPQPVV